MLPNSTHNNGTRFIDHQAGSKSMSALHLCIEKCELKNFNVLLTHQPEAFPTDIFQLQVFISQLKTGIRIHRQIITTLGKEGW